MTRVLVTGATGFAGRHLIERLGDDVHRIGWYRPSGRAPQRNDVEWQPVDILDAAAVRRAIQDSRPTGIYHLAGAPNVATSWQNVVTHLQINALGTHHLLEGVRAEVPSCRVVVVSSALVYRSIGAPIGEDAPLQPSNPYGLSKLAQDQLALRAALDQDLDVVIARPFNHIGPRQDPGFAISNFARQIALIERGAAEPVLRVGNLDAQRDVTDVRDVVDAYVKLMAGGVRGRAYNVCSGRAWRMRDLLDVLLESSSTPIRVETDSTRLRPNDTPVIQGDPSRIQQELRWTPVYPIQQSLRDTLEAWRAETGLNF